MATASEAGTLLRRANGTSSATGRRSTVTVTCSPLSTRRKTSLTVLRSSRTETVPLTMESVAHIPTCTTLRSPAAASVHPRQCATDANMRRFSICVKEVLTHPGPSPRAEAETCPELVRDAGGRRRHGPPASTAIHVHGRGRTASCRTAKRPGVGEHDSFLEGVEIGAVRVRAPIGRSLWFVGVRRVAKRPQGGWIDAVRWFACRPCTFPTSWPNASRLRLRVEE